MSSNKTNTLKVVFAAAATTYVFRIINATSGLVTLPLILASLGKNEYGLWVLVGQVTRFLAMSDMGIANAIGRFVAKFRGNGDTASIDKLLSTSIILTSALALVVAGLTLALAPWMQGLLGIDIQYSDTARTVFTITGISMALIFPTRIGMGILTGYQLYGPHGIGKILTSVFFLSSILILVAFKHLNVVSLAFSSGLSVIIGQAIVFFVAWRMTGPWKIRFSLFSWDMSKDVFSLGSSSLMVTLSKLFYNQGMGIALGRISGLGSVAIYGIASTIVMEIEPIIGAIGSAMPTLASEFKARGEMERLKKIVNMTIQVTFALTLSAIAGLYIYSEPVLRLFLRKGHWAPDDFIQITNAVIIMSAGVAIWLPQLVSRSTLQAVGKHWAVTHAVLASSAFSLLCGIILMNFGWGVYGAAFGFSLALLIQGIFLFPPMICKFLGQSIPNMIANAYVPGFLPGLAVLIISWTFAHFLKPDNLINLGIGVSMTALLGISILILVSGQTAIIFKTARKFLKR